MEIRKFAVILLFFTSYCQAQWPPGGVTPSDSLKHFHLPGSRFVPSTKRWNLVWADQLIPGNISTVQVQFAAEHYVATQKVWDYQTKEFRKFNPNFLVIIYHLAAGLNPLHNADCPDPKSNSDTGFIGDITPKGYDSEFKDYFIPWLASHGISEGDPGHERMFQHFDAIDSLHRVWHQDPAWLMNLADTNWQKYCGDICLDWMKGNTDDGCFFDVAVETNSSLYHPQKSDPSPRNFDWWMSPHGPASDRSTFSQFQNQVYLRCYQNIYKRFHSDTLDYLVIPNTDQMVTTVYDPVWTDGDGFGETIDGAMMEGFGKWTGFDMWQTLERGLRHITGRGKILIAQFNGVDSVERLRRTAMYMLIKNENSFLNIINGSGLEWYPEYEIDLGDQSPLPQSLVPLRIAGNDWHSLWERDYARGKVFCNTSDAAMNVSAPSAGTWAKISTSGGGNVSAGGLMQPQHISYLPVSGTISISPSGALILRRMDSIASVQSEIHSGITIGVNPNPIQTSASIHIHNDRMSVMRINVMNMLGEEVGQIFSGELEAGEHSFAWDSRNLPNGTYTCLLRTPEAGTQIRLIVLK